MSAPGSTAPDVSTTVPFNVEVVPPCANASELLAHIASTRAATSPSLNTLRFIEPPSSKYKLFWEEAAEHPRNAHTGRRVKVYASLVLTACAGKVALEGWFRQREKRDELRKKRDEMRIWRDSTIRISVIQGLGANGRTGSSRGRRIYRMTSFNVFRGARPLPRRSMRAQPHRRCCAPQLARVRGG